MAGRFPGARDVAELWRNLEAGRETIERFTEEELRSRGLWPEADTNKSYVPARGTLDGAELFDARLFRVSPRDAELIDPQARVFLECAHEALERAAIDLGRFSGIGAVFAGSSWSTYLTQLEANGLGSFDVYFKNDKDFLTSWVASKLDLTGPTIGVQCYCATSLAAVHLACASLNAGECDLALAGGVTIAVPLRTGYFYREGGLFSADGHSRPFDARASGTVFGDGAGVVVLRRLDDAINAGDPILAVIKGSAIVNDGARKMSFLAPSPAGQSQAAVQALSIAGVDARSIGYVEAHGTATLLGDSVEIAALAKAYGREHRPGGGWCSIGSIKGNVGHLDRASGIVSLIKTIDVLRRGVIPPSINCETPNPEINFAATPFRMASERSQWSGGSKPRRAAVNTFAIGGTNVHLVLEEAPRRSRVQLPASMQVLPISARSEPALRVLATRLADHLAEHPGLSVSDVAATLQDGRAVFEHRRAIVCRDLTSAIELLRATASNFSASEGREVSLARAFEAGKQVDWHDLGGERRRQHVELPPHPFEHQRFWIEPPKSAHKAAPVPGPQHFVPSWTRAAPLFRPDRVDSVIVILADRAGLAERLGAEAESRGATVYLLRDVVELPAALAQRRAPLSIIDARDFHETTLDAPAFLARRAELLRLLPLDDLGLIFVSDRVVDVSGSDPLLSEKAGVAAEARVIATEHPNVRVRVLDVATEDMSLILSAALAPNEAAFFALRGGNVWRPSFERFEPRAAAKPSTNRFLILGASGTVGAAVARHLARTIEAPRLVLFSRRKLEAPEALAIAGDVADPHAIGAALDLAGEGCCVIYAAGSSDGFGSLAAVHSTADIAAHFTSRVAGLVALRDVIEARSVSAVVVVSSTATVCGGLGLSAYAASHAVQEAFVRAESRRGKTRWVTVQLDRLTDGQFPGEALDSALGAVELQHLIHGAADLPERASRRASPLVSRPRLENEYVAPRSQIELRLSDLFSATLGVARVGCSDNFFALGGDSVAAIHLLGLVANVLGAKVTPADFFERATISGLVAAIERQKEAPLDAPRKVDRRSVARTKDR